MRILSRFLRGDRASETNLTRERRSFARSMPGQTAALAAQRFGYILN